jgi:phospholipase A1
MDGIVWLVNITFLKLINISAILVVLITTESTEVKFQISFKFPLAYHFFTETDALYFAFTSLSYWQLYNRDISSPFRETNYEPEVWWQFPFDWNALGFKGRIASLGLVHQSNGRSEFDQAPLSRSWNRIYANFVFERGIWALALKPWWRIPEDDENDNNPDIHNYLGCGESLLDYNKNNTRYGIGVAINDVL